MRKWMKTRTHFETDMKPFNSKYALIFMLLGVAVSRGYFDVVWKVFSPLEGVTYLFIIIITIINKKVSHSNVLMSTSS